MFALKGEEEAVPISSLETWNGTSDTVGPRKVRRGTQGSQGAHGGACAMGPPQHVLH